MLLTAYANSLETQLEAESVSIADLTREDFLAFHEKYCHPSNARIYLYGNGDTSRAGQDDAVLALDGRGVGLRRRRVVDGDDLRNLAQRYLNDANRALEIFHANRDVLEQPDLLPLGVELQIPIAFP